jgi:hypothetical protein
VEVQRRPSTPITHKWPTTKSLQPNKFFPTMEKTTLESCILFTTKFILRRDTIWMAADGAGIVLSKKKRPKFQKVLPSGETGFGGGGEASNL